MILTWNGSAYEAANFPTEIDLDRKKLYIYLGEAQSAAPQILTAGTSTQVTIVPRKLMISDPKISGAFWNGVYAECPWGQILSWRNPPDIWACIKPLTIPSRPSGGELYVISANLGNFSAASGYVAKLSSTEVERSARNGLSIRDPDIVFLQELAMECSPDLFNTSGACAEFFGDQSVSLGHPQIYRLLDPKLYEAACADYIQLGAVASGFFGKPAYECVAVKKNKLKIEKIGLVNPIGDTCKPDTGAVIATITELITNRKFKAASYHSVSPGEFGDMGCRVKQLDTLFSSEQPELIAGDFNLDPTWPDLFGQAADVVALRKYVGETNGDKRYVYLTDPVNQKTAWLYNYFSKGKSAADHIIAKKGFATGSCKIITKTLTGTGRGLGEGSVDHESLECSLTLNQPAQPRVTSFAASPSSINPGGSSTLSWTITGTQPITLNIDNGIGDVTGSAGKTVSPTQTTTYTLTATNSAGTAKEKVTVTVENTGKSYTLSSKPDGTGQIGADDDLNIYLNGKAIYIDTLPGAGPSYGPLKFEAKAGDTLRLEAINAYSTGPDTCVVSDVYLTDSTGKSLQVVSRSDWNPACPRIFLDKTVGIPW
jgi:hypothetical protein